MVHSMWLAACATFADCGGGGARENSKTRSTLVYAAKMVDFSA